MVTLVTTEGWFAQSEGAKEVSNKKITKPAWHVKCVVVLRHLQGGLAMYYWS